MSQVKKGERKDHIKEMGNDLKNNTMQMKNTVFEEN